MSQMIQDLLEFSRVQRSDSELAPTDLNEVFQQALTNCSASIRNTRAVVTSENLPTVPGDRNQLIQLLQNLIGNGVKFHRPGERPAVYLSALRSEEYWVFRMRDNGIGIPTDQVDKVFQPFHRLHSRDRYPGTGVGLAICKKIVERHKGKIWIEPSEGEGTTICFSFPEGGTDRPEGGPRTNAASQIPAS
jgi:light-regulated signal transduction histidine kinase (bacteriophytochrome)